MAARREDWVGPGTGSEGEMLERKIAAVEKAVALHRDHLSDPLEVLRRLGGREIAAMAGAILAARMETHPGHHRRLCRDGCRRDPARPPIRRRSTIA